MKKILSILIMSYALLASAQSGTTLEEYRYLTKGYAYQKEMGLDATKDGYQFRQLYEHPNGIKFIGMYRIPSTSPQAVLAILTNGNKHTYICLPNNGAGEEVMKQYQSDLGNKLAGSAQKQKFNDASRGLLFHVMGDRSQINLAANALAPSSAEPEMTSKGIPIQTYDYQAANSPAHISTATNAPSAVNQEPAVAGNSGSMVVNQKVQTNISGELLNRSLINPPVVYGTYTNRGKVVIKVCVDAAGEIKSAKFTQRGSTTFNPELKKMAIDSALATRFNSSEQREQCGVIAYHFK